MAVYSVQGWFDGESDCEPPEPGKYWLTILEHDEEFALVVHRGSLLDPVIQEKEKRAEWIASALNAFEDA